MAGKQRKQMPVAAEPAAGSAPALTGTVRTSHELKQLRTRREKLVVDIEARKADLKTAEEAYVKAKSQLEAVDVQIAALSREGQAPIVSEHALLRYIERAMGIDLEAVRAEILTPRNTNAIKTLQTCKLPLGNQLKAVVKEGVVVSIVDC